MLAISVTISAVLTLESLDDIAGLSLGPWVLVVFYTNEETTDFEGSVVRSGGSLWERLLAWAW
jgi:hypothetical protein